MTFISSFYIFYFYEAFCFILFHFVMNTDHQSSVDKAYTGKEVKDNTG